MVSVTVRDTLESNPLCLRLLSTPISTSLSLLFESFNSDILGEKLLSSFVLLLSIRSASNPAVQCLSCLDSALALDGLGTNGQNYAHMPCFSWNPAADSQKVPYFGTFTDHLLENFYRNVYILQLK